MQKYSSTGNTFIILDNTHAEHNISDVKKLAKFGTKGTSGWCHFSGTRRPSRCRLQNALPQCGRERGSNVRQRCPCPGNFHSKTDPLLIAPLQDRDGRWDLRSRVHPPPSHPTYARGPGSGNIGHFRSLSGLPVPLHGVRRPPCHFFS